MSELLPLPDYRGRRPHTGPVIEFRNAQGDWVELPLRLDLADHSPDGPEWGYAGAGPAQSALALCAHALHDDDRALGVYQVVKARLLANLSWACGFELSRVQIVAVVEEVECERIRAIRDQLDREASA